MKTAKDDVDVKLEIPGAVLRQRMDFGDVTGFSKISTEYFSLSAGVDTAPLFQGLEGDLCQCPHWGFVLRGQITTTDANGIKETVNANDLFYWPAAFRFFFAFIAYLSENIQNIMLRISYISSKFVEGYFSDSIRYCF